MKFLLEIAAAYHKWRAKRCYLAMLAKEDDADCGRHLLLQVSPGYRRLCEKFESHLRASGYEGEIN